MGLGQPVPADRRRRSLTRRLALAVLLLMGLLGAGALLLAARYGPYLDQLRDLRTAAQRVSSQLGSLDPLLLDGAAVRELGRQMLDMRERMVPLQELMTDDPLVGLAGGLPLSGPEVSAARSLLAAADRLLEAGRLGLDVAERYVALRARQETEPDFSMTAGLAELMVGAGADADRLAELIEAARGHLASVPAGVSGPMKGLRDLMSEPLERYAPLLDEYRRLDDALPGMLGWGDQKRYLVLAQDPAELRPAGGYIGTVGILGLRDGRIVEQRFSDVYEYDARPGIPLIEPPAALRDHLVGSEGWRLADAAWAVDFPTAARDVIRLYASETGDADVDGVIAITTYSLDRLLEVIGPVTVPGYDLTVRPGEVTLTLLAATRGTAEDVSGRKDVLDELARVVLERVIAPRQEDLAGLARAAEDVARRRLVLAWFADPAAQALASGRPWSGEVRTDAGDYLYVVSSNVAPTSKYDLVVDRDTTLDVELAPDGEAFHVLRLDWHNGADQPGEPYASLRAWSTSGEGLYATYTRVLAPADSQLLFASGQAIAEIGDPELIDEEAGRAVFANYVLMSPGEAHMGYEWTSRAGGAARDEDGTWRYSLVVQKQPGQRPERLHLRIRLPQGARLVSAGDGLAAAGEEVSLEMSLLEDLELELTYRLAGSGGDGR